VLRKRSARDVFCVAILSRSEDSNWYSRRYRSMRIWRVILRNDSVVGNAKSKQDVESGTGHAPRPWSVRIINVVDLLLGGASPLAGRSQGFYLTRGRRWRFQLATGAQARIVGRGAEAATQLIAAASPVR